MACEAPTGTEGLCTSLPTPVSLLCRSPGFMQRRHRCGGHVWSPWAGMGLCRVAAHLDSREVRWSAVVGSGLMGGEVTKAAALAQFLLQ